MDELSGEWLDGIVDNVRRRSGEWREFTVFLLLDLFDKVPTLDKVRSE
jgi:hypothetical protein